MAPSLTVLMVSGGLQAFIGLIGFIVGMEVMDDPDGVLLVYAISQLGAIAFTEPMIKAVAAVV